MNRYKIISVIFLLLIFGFNASAQDTEFKEVKTGDDVIDNYILANGGKENLEKISSVKMTGVLEVMGRSLPMTVYTSNDYFYVNIEEPSFGSTVAVDKKNKIGWQKAMGNVKDFSEGELIKFEEMLEGSLWGHLLHKEKYNLNYVFKGIENVDDISAYVIDFTRDSNLLYTTYYDTAGYNRIKQIKDGSESHFEDFRLVDNYGIKMPFKITEQFPITVQKYEFNTEFDKSLLNKPEIKQ